MRYLFRQKIPRPARILLVESGSRGLVERVLPVLRGHFGQETPIDLVTCYAGVPVGLAPDAEVYRVADYSGKAGHRRLYREVRARRHTIAGIVCSAEPVMTKWKWALTALLPVKVLVINENGDFFWLDYGRWRIISRFVLYRGGLAGGGAVRILTRLLMFPLTILYLLAFAAVVHLRRLGRKVYS